MNEREQLLSNITNCAETMKAIGRKEDECDSLEKKIEKFKPLCGKKGILIYLVVAFAFCAIAIPKQLTLCLIVLIGFPILCVFIAKNKQKSMHKNIDKINEEIIVLQNNFSLSWLPAKYRLTVPYHHIAEYVSDMRANNLKEALNLYETELHQARLEIYAAVNSLNN